MDCKTKSHGCKDPGSRWLVTVSFMPKRNLRIVTQDVPIIGICEACNTQFKSLDVNEAERVVKAQFDAHECKPMDASQNAVRIVREATSMTPKRKRQPRRVSSVIMAKPFVQPANPRRRGNPNWGRSGQPFHPAPTAATEFERKLRELGLTKETCASSVQLQTWCAQNKNRCYIPEWLLKTWRMQVDSDLSGAG